MASTSPSQVDVDRLTPGPATAMACAPAAWPTAAPCRSTVRLPDLVRLQLVDAFEAEHEAPKQIARRLAKAGGQHFNFKRSIFTLARRASGDCLYSDAQGRAAARADEQRPGHLPQAPPGGAAAGLLRLRAGRGKARGASGGRRSCPCRAGFVLHINPSCRDIEPRVFA